MTEPTGPAGERAVTASGADDHARPQGETTDATADATADVAVGERTADRDEHTPAGDGGGQGGGAGAADPPAPSAPCSFRPDQRPPDTGREGVDRDSAADEGSGGPGQPGPASAPVLVVMDPTDEAALTAAVLAAHDVTAGRIVIHPTPAAPGRRSLALDLLAALGKPVEQLDAEHLTSSGLAHQAALAWLNGERHQRLIVLRAHLMTAARWRDLLEVRRRTGIALVLIYHAPRLSASHAAVLEGVPHHRTDELTDAVAAADPAGGGEHTGRPAGPAGTGAATAAGALTLHRLPEADFPFFRAHLHRRLPIEQVAEADACYRHAAGAACRWLAAHPTWRRTNPPPPTAWQQLLPPLLSAEQTGQRSAILQNHYSADERAALASGLLCLGRAPHLSEMTPTPWSDVAGLHRFLCELVADAPSPAHTLIRIRGAQASFFAHGLLLTVPRTLRLHCGPGLDTALTVQLSDRIRRRLAHPQRAAALACALLTHLPMPLLAALPCGALSPSARRLRIGDGCVYAIPAHARGLFAAARAFDQLHGPTTGAVGRLLASGLGSGGQYLRASAEACEVVLPSHLNDPSSREPWHRQATCWWIGAPLHGPDARHYPDPDPV